MKKEEIVHYRYRSDVRPEVCTTDEDTARAIAWADANPRVWRIVTEKRSNVFGRNSSAYFGWARQGETPEAILERVRHFHSIFYPGLPKPDQNILVWRANFTFEHYDEPGFRGGVFRQWDQNQPHDNLTLDYTPVELERVIDRFEAWIDKTVKTVRIMVNGETVREYGYAVGSDKPTRIPRVLEGGVKFALFMEDCIPDDAMVERLLALPYAETVSSEAAQPYKVIFHVEHLSDLDRTIIRDAKRQVREIINPRKR